MRPLTHRGLLLAAWIFLGLNIGLGISVLHHFMSGSGNPVGGDFVSYWAAARLAVLDRAGEIYQFASLARMEDSAQPGMTRHMAWFYPPFFLLLVLPLGWLHYLAAYPLFSTASALLFFTSLRRWLPAAGFGIVIAAFPGLWRNLIDGQNGLLTASLAALTCWWLPRHPRLAGVSLGLLAIKPHLGLLFPLWLLHRRAWPTMISATACIAGMAAVCTLLFGVDIWAASLDGLRNGRHYLETSIPLHRMPTIFALLRGSGASLTQAWLAHGLIAVLAVLAMLRIWTLTNELILQMAALIAATLLLSPYLFDYDSVWLLLAGAGLLRHADATRWLPGERLWLLLAWLAPLYPQLILVVFWNRSLQIAPILSLALLLLLLRRADLLRHGTLTKRIHSETRDAL